MYKLILKLQSQIQQTPSVKGQRVDFIDAVGMWALLLLLSCVRL